MTHFVTAGKGDLNVPLLNGFENGVNSGPESDKDMEYNKKNQKDATSGRYTTINDTWTELRKKGLVYNSNFYPHYFSYHGHYLCS